MVRYLPVSRGDDHAARGTADETPVDVKLTQTVAAVDGPVLRHDWSPAASFRILRQDEQSVSFGQPASTIRFFS